MGIKKKIDDVRYIPLDEVKKLNDEYLNEIESVKRRLTGIKDEAIIKKFHEVLLTSFSGAIEIKARECAVDYNIKIAEIEARADELTPAWYRHWWWVFRAYPNRAQEIIEERAELDADVIHSEAEKKLDDDWKRFFSEPEKKPAVKPSKREIKRLARKLLEEAIQKAETEINSAFDEPPDVPPVQELVDELEQKHVQTDPPKAECKKAESEPGQLPGQMTLYDVQVQQQIASVRRARPPRSCRRQ